VHVLNVDIKQAVIRDQATKDDGQTKNSNLSAGACGGVAWLLDHPKLFYYNLSESIDKRKEE
jgi:hypothetical protein